MELSPVSIDELLERERQRLDGMEATFGPIPAFAGTPLEGLANLPGEGRIVSSDMFPLMRSNLSRAARNDPESLWCPDCGESIFAPHCCDDADSLNMGLVPEGHRHEACVLCAEADQHEYGDSRGGTSLITVTVPILFIPSFEHAYNPLIGMAGLRRYGVHRLEVCSGCAAAALAHVTHRGRLPAIEHIRPGVHDYTSLTRALGLLREPAANVPSAVAVPNAPVAPDAPDADGVIDLTGDEDEFPA